MECSLLWHTLTYYLYSCSIILPHCTEVKTIQNEHLMMCSELQYTTVSKTTVFEDLTTTNPTTVSQTTISQTTSSLGDLTTVSETSPPTTSSPTTGSPTTGSPTTISQTTSSLGDITVSETTSSPTITQTTIVSDIIPKFNVSFNTFNNTYVSEDFVLLNNIEEKINYSWIWVLLFFFILTGVMLFFIIKKQKAKNIVYPKQVYLIQKEKNKPFNTIVEIQEDINKAKKKSIQNKKLNEKKLDQEAYKIYLKKKYPGVEFDLAHQLYKNKKLMKRTQEKLKKSKIKLKITEIPTEKADLETMIKTSKVKPNMKTIASMRVKNDKILQMMREKKIVKNNRFKK